MDKIDRKILSLLQHDASLSVGTGRGAVLCVPWECVRHPNLGDDQDPEVLYVLDEDLGVHVF